MTPAGDVGDGILRCLPVFGDFASAAQFDEFWKNFSFKEEPVKPLSQ